MTHIDKYYFFLFNSISAANSNPKYRFFFNTTKNVLIMKLANNVNDEMLNNWIELPKLTYFDKKSFLKSFSDRQDELFQKEINKLIKNYKEDSDFNLTNDLKKIDLGIAFKFEMERGSFLHENIDELYKDLNLNEKLSLDFSDVQGGGGVN